MAAKQQTIDEAIESLFNKTNKAIKHTINIAANKVQRDIQDKAKELINEYYASYKPPHMSYRRTKQLPKSIVKYSSVTEGTRSGHEGYSKTVGVSFDSSKLKNAYKSHSQYHQEGQNWNDIVSRSNSSSNGVPDPSWILSNFWEGIHPATNGYPLSGVDHLEYYEIQTTPIKDSFRNWLNNYTKDELPIILIKYWAQAISKV